jgi:hypothetical protein
VYELIGHIIIKLGTGVACSPSNTRFHVLKIPLQKHKKKAQKKSTKKKHKTDTGVSERNLIRKISVTFVCLTHKLEGANPQATARR